MASPLQPGPSVLVFDGDCGLCTRWVRRILLWNRAGRLTVMPLQDDAARERLGIRREDAEAAVWLVRPSRQAGQRDDRLRGAAAMSAVADLLLGTHRLGADGLLLGLHRLPVVRTVMDAAYAWVATHRHRLPGMVPWCRVHPERCGRRSSGSVGS